MRVADCLQDSNEAGKKTRRRKRRNLGSSPPHYEPQTPRSFLSRWFFKTTTPPSGDLRGGAVEGLKLGCLVPFSNTCCNNEEETEDRKQEEGFDSDEGKETIPAIVESIEGHREKNPEALSFNLGMGAGLVFLLAKSSNEFNKMVELRSEMEMMIKYIKAEIQRKASSSILPESKLLSFPTSNYFGSEFSNKPQHLHEDAESCNFAGAFGSTAARRQPPNQNVDSDAKMCSKGDEMEEELQIELHRLQLKLENEDSSLHPYQNGLEVESESSESFNVTNQQVNEPSKAETSQITGVCPRELEKRLHELLEARQQERIMELESALESAQRKLNEKEMEICWWRDTARLVSKRREERLQLQF
ncbi:protein POLAR LOCALIZATION DURING ASYMMETRIC DIVISION AND REDISTRIBUTION-like [Phalaenopsis equestris]|uniref:protein POLAR LOCALIZATION DURING ASYMMETRIC DIVISION AND REDISTRIBUTION-like n=1 Tax=Phalaenopsis equestris TaxID=78828 RepID=UPI0009E2584E|nr:protein POLAR LOCALIZATION DURING ASYMMETRIC DIVISION AND REDISTRIBUTION-like [Phalaenopsis equestris]